MDGTQREKDGRGDRHTARQDMIAGLLLLGLAVFLFNASFGIPADMDESGIGPRSFPQGICILMGLIGGVMALQGARGRTAPGDKSSLHMGEFARVVLPLIGVSFLCVWLFKLFGYIAATLTTLWIACYLFRVRGKALYLLPPAISLIFYYVFFGLMGVFEPPAELFNVMDLFR